MDVAALLEEVLKIYSPPHGEGELARWLQRYLRQYVPDVWIDEAGNVIAVKGRGEPVVWLHAHMDTVPGPLPVRREGDVLWGRGAVDDKGPLAAYTKAFLEAEPRGTLVLALVTAEEDDSAGTEALLKGGPPRPRYIYVGEPTSLHVAYAYRGGAKVYIELESRGGHASSPIYGNIVEELYAIYQEIKRALGHAERYDAFTVTPTVINCGDAPNKIPTRCTMVLDVRIPPGRTCHDLLSALPPQARARSCVEPAEVSPINPAARALIRGLLKLGLEPKLSKKWGTADFNLLVDLTRDIAAFGPGDPRLAHTEDEHIDVKEVELAAEVLKNAIAELK
ncbi:acetylornithine deacetylase / N2-acetyl-L-lysine deacetylase [Pyrobaculum islandicum DSM 4184]|uniref:Putative [LysW]-lysine/[LysW]-ornithine hydrolase n=1 Tax=Pyrobaculum islandicum (strain DSM 4184 / JCM 9189 / GEO3) TaxID=384616 RepID=A1RUC2_PYRIL|nr:M20/M25/M40 family metallo-hydrolase [Pyrobaculum islandicum]ABL88554.1 acetylornithine deacetylase / N2-acetyl-L-lysine deacetylase [Pyrobaculum islandicum DSM 4184]